MFIAAGIYMGLMITGISTGYSGKGRGAQHALDGLDELSPLTAPHVVIGRFDHHSLLSIRFLDRQSALIYQKEGPLPEESIQEIRCDGH